jgi:hypothetical protein
MPEVGATAVRTVRFSARFGRVWNRNSGPSARATTKKSSSGPVLQYVSATPSWRSMVQSIRTVELSSMTMWTNHEHSRSDGDVQRWIAKLGVLSIVEALGRARVRASGVEGSHGTCAVPGETPGLRGQRGETVERR